MNELIKKALSVFPDQLKNPILKASLFSSEIFEIRLINSKCVFFNTKNGIRFVTKNGSADISYTENVLVPIASELEEISDRAVGYSGFLYEKQLKEGYVTYSDGFRMGICTNGFQNDFSAGKINSINIRIPVFENISYPKVPEEVLFNLKNGLLIAGAPGCGKTTLLRYLSKKISDGALGEYKKISVIDERGELGAKNDLGVCADIIGGKSKGSAILHALRVMSPQYIICDEIGSFEDTKAILEGLNSGVIFIASIHAGNLSSLVKRGQFKILFNENVFDKVIFLSSLHPGEITDIYSYEEIKDEICRSCNSRTFNQF